MELVTDIRKAASIVGRGFLLGLGFSFGLAVAYYFVIQAMTETFHKQTMQLSDQAKFGSASIKELVLSDVAERTHDGVTIIVGSVRNSGKNAVHGVEVEADLFSKGVFVDKYSTSLSGPLEPGQSNYFKISCGCKDTPPAAHDSYKVKVVNTY